MKKRLWILAAAWLLAAVMLLGGVSPALADAPVYRQTHVVERFQQKNAAYANRYYDGCGYALDGADGRPDLCLPGLTEEDNMVPQGIAYYAAKNQMLISAYSKGDAGSVIFALDLSDGHLAAEYHITRRSGNPAQAHFGGIAVSEYNLYIADYDSTISYVPLSALNAADGTAADVTGECELSGYDGTPGVKTVVASYGGMSTAFTVVVRPKAPTKLAVTSPPAKREYALGEEVDLSGLEVTATYDNGTS